MVPLSIFLRAVLLWLVFAGTASSGVCADIMNEPWHWAVPATSHGPSALVEHKSEALAAGYLSLFREWISPVDGSNCPMNPSCSRYSSQCIEKHGVAVGVIMTWDRLLRCGRDELDLGRRIVVSGLRKLSDPVSDNDFWWIDQDPIGLIPLINLDLP